MASALFLIVNAFSPVIFSAQRNMKLCSISRHARKRWETSAAKSYRTGMATSS